jgi:apolipoprotein D and lipocalin family protein
MYALAVPVLLLAFLQGAAAQTVTAIPQLDLNRFTGTWYEIARLSNHNEKNCVADVITLIAPADKPNRVQIVLACKVKKGYSDARNATGKKQDKSGDGKVKVSFLWPFYSKYWVLGIDPENTWALVGSPNHKDLWVLSRTPVMKPEVLSEIEAKASAQGFPVAKLTMTPQRGL